MLGNEELGSDNMRYRYDKWRANPEMHAMWANYGSCAKPWIKGRVPWVIFRDLIFKISTSVMK